MAGEQNPTNGVAPQGAKNKYYCGVSFELGGKEISLNPSTAINEIKTKGLECSLPDRVPLGRVSDIFDSVTSTLGAADYTWQYMKDQIKDIPVLSGGVELLGDANLAVEQFHLKMAPTFTQPPTPDGGTQPALVKIDKPADNLYTVGMSMLWTGDTGTLFGDLKLKGLFFKVSNEE